MYGAPVAADRVMEGVKLQQQFSSAFPARGWGALLLGAVVFETRLGHIEPGDMSSSRGLYSFMGMLG